MTGNCRPILDYLGEISSSWRILTCSSYSRRFGTRVFRASGGKTCSSRRWRSWGSAFSFRSSASRTSSRRTASSAKPWGNRSSSSSVTRPRTSLFSVSIPPPTPPPFPSFPKVLLSSWAVRCFVAACCKLFHALKLTSIKVGVRDFSFFLFRSFPSRTYT